MAAHAARWGGTGRAPSNPPALGLGFDAWGHSRETRELAGAVGEGATPCTDGRPSENTPPWLGLHQSSLPNAAKGYPPREPRECDLGHACLKAVNNSSFSTPKMIALRAPSHAPTGTPTLPHAEPRAAGALHDPLHAHRVKTARTSPRARKHAQRHFRAVPCASALCWHPMAVPSRPHQPRASRTTRARRTTTHAATRAPQCTSHCSLRPLHKRLHLLQAPYRTGARRDRQGRAFLISR